MDHPENYKDLHGSILTSVLVKLPLKSVITCKLVCKYWYNLISDSSFGQAYNNVKPFKCNLCFNSYSDLYLMETTEKELFETPFNLKLHVPIGENQILGIAGICNGLFCFLVKTPSPVDELETIFYVYNPLTCEYVQISDRLRLQYDVFHRTSFGFGCSKYTNEYKVVSFLDRIPPGSTMQGNVITVGVDSRWREYRSDQCIDWTCSNYPVLFNGVLHWVGYVISSPAANVIYALDLEKEKGERMELPLPLQSIRDASPCIGLLNDHLCAVPRWDSFCVWIMEDYRVVESWTKYLSFKDPIPQFCFIFYYSFVCNMPSFNREQESMNLPYQTVSYVPCFSSLKDVLKGL